jgi:putative transposase
VLGNPGNRAILLPAEVKWFLTKLMKKPCRVPRVMVTGKLRSCGIVRRDLLPSVEHRFYKGLHNWAENSHRPTSRRERVMKGFRHPAQRSGS